MPAPSRVRYGVLMMLCFLAMITYMDRAANGTARDSIMEELNLSQPADQKYSKNDFFYVLMAFQLAYALFEVPSGWLGDTFGPRSTLLRVVVWWTIFVALTGFVGMKIAGVFIGFSALMLIQFLFGVGEAGAFPNIAKSLYNWFPASARGSAKSAVWMSARLMGGLTPLVWVLLTGPAFGGLTWRQAMWLFAALALVWCIVFYFTFRNKPEEHPGVNEAERDLINEGRVTTPGKVSVPWGKILRSRNLYAVCLMYVVTNFCWYYLMYNHPAAMKNAYPDLAKTPLGQVQLALLSGAPLLIGMLGCFLGGVLSDWYIRRTGDRKWGRRWFGILGYTLAGICYLFAAGVKYSDPTNLWLFAGLLILMGFFNDLIMAPSWAVCQDIGQEYAATVSGAMNMFGNLFGAVMGILITGRIIESFNTSGQKSLEAISALSGTVAFAQPAVVTTPFETQSVIVCFTMYAVVYFVGAVMWLFIDPTKSVLER
jgi:MFS transporter, ACS family, glucarate transporter